MMTRARRVALAALIGACFWGAPLFAQSVAPVGAYGAPYQSGEWECPPEAGDPGCFKCGKMFDGAFLRVEYLHWNLDNPGSTRLGAPLASVGNTSSPFFVFDPGTLNVNAVATVPTTQHVDLRDVNGIRATAGFDLVYGGTIEVGAFMLGKKNSGYEVANFPLVDVINPDDPFGASHLVTQQVGTSVLTNGQIGNTIFLYNKEYRVRYASQLWGAEGNYIFDSDREGLFWLNPTIGVRYFSLHEKLLQRGVFQDTVIGTEAITTTIDSTTNNHLYGPQFGARLELVSKYINMGLDPKLMLLGNSMHTNVTTNHLRSNNDPIVSTGEYTNKFSLGVDIGTYAQINFGPSFSARVGYNFIWFNKVTRPEDNIYYNDNGPAQPPAVVSQLTLHDFVVHGVSVGGELRF